MKRIVIGGQLEKQTLLKKVKEIAGDNAIITVKSDMEAAQDIMTNTADFYIGACDTGGGGALAMAIALLSINKCKTVSTQTSKASKKDMEEALDKGIVAFGMIPRDIDYILEILIPLMLIK